MENIVSKASFQCLALSISLTVTLFILWYGSYGNDDFSIAGGAIGGVSALFVLFRIITKQNSSPLDTLLFWRALCDFGLAARFIAIPAFNMLICGSTSCTRATANSSYCPLPSFLFQFFLIGAESWVCCNGLDLYWSIKNPFSTFQSRLLNYHMLAWGAALTLSVTPFIFDIYTEVYGFWYISNYHDESAICWILITNPKKLGYSLWFYYVLPILLYLLVLLAVVIAYFRLFKLTNSFVPQLPSFAANALNIFIITCYWGLNNVIYATAFSTRNDDTPLSETFFNILTFYYGAKGIASLFTWIFCANFPNPSLEDAWIQNGFKSLRQEILTFATVGIRSTADYNPVTNETDYLTGHVVSDQTAIVDRSFLTPWFFMKFMFGGKMEMITVREALSNSSRIKISEKPLTERIFSSSIESAGSSIIGEEGLEANTSTSTYGFRYEVESSLFERRTSTNARAFSQFWQFVKNSVDLEHSDLIEFIEYQPYHFRRVRLAFGILDHDYSEAFSATIKERVSEGGASGAFFFFSKGERFLAKSCTKEEMHTLRENAKSYADFMTTNPLTNISKIFGLYELKIYGNTLCFFVMNNLFYNQLNLTIHEKYDIKGSWVARNASPPIDGKLVTCSHCEQKFTYRRKNKKRSFSQVQSLKIAGKSYDLQPRENIPSPIHDTEESGTKSAQIDSSLQEQSACSFTVSGNHEPNIILKDNDIKHKIRFSAKDTIEFLSQIRIDCDFLHSLGIMDYSLLIGIHNTEYEIATTTSEPSTEESLSSKELKLLTNRKSRKSSTGTLSDGIELNSTALILSHGERIRKTSRVIGPDCYFMGIIDFQQKWNFQKKMERFLKIHLRGADSKGLSAIEPSEYKERFLRKMEDILDIDIPEEEQYFIK